MQQPADNRLAEAREELIRDRATFEERVRSVLEQLTREKLQLAGEWRRLLAGRQRLVLVGRRLRQRWHCQRTANLRELDSAEAQLSKKLQQAEKAERKSNIERSNLRSLRERLASEASVLKKERAELIAYRSRFEAERLGWQESHQSRVDEERELQRRVLALRQELEELQQTQEQVPMRTPFGDGELQKVA